MFDRRRFPEVFLIVRPETVIGWHRQLVARHWNQQPTAQQGRPPLEPEVRKLVIRPATENPDCRYRRIHGELTRLGRPIAAPTVWKILRATGIDPAHDRTGPTSIANTADLASGLKERPKVPERPDTRSGLSSGRAL